MKGGCWDLAHGRQKFDENWILLPCPICSAPGYEPPAIEYDSSEREDGEEGRSEDSEEDEDDYPINIEDEEDEEDAHEDDQFFDDRGVRLIPYWLQDPSERNFVDLHGPNSPPPGILASHLPLLPASAPENEPFYAWTISDSEDSDHPKSEPDSESWSPGVWR